MPPRGWKKKQILCWGQWVAASLSIAEKLKELMEQVPFYCLKGSPLNESPLGLFNVEEDGAILEEIRHSAPLSEKPSPARGQ
jgi:serine protein kinase